MKGKIELENIDKLALNALNSIGDGVIITDLNERIIYINEAAEDITGWTYDGAIGKKFNLVFKLINNRTKRKVPSPLKDVISNKDSTGLKNYSALLLKDKSTKYVSANCSPMKDENGVVKGATIVFRDINILKEKEEKLIEVNEYSKKILESFPTMVWQSDVQGNTIYVNSNWTSFLGIGLEEALGTGWAKAIHPDDRQRSLEIIKKANEIQIPFDIEHRFKRYDGEYRWCLSMGAPFYNLDNKFIGYVGIVIDITERKREREGLEKYEILSKNARDIILFVDIEGNIIEANDSAVKAYGYTYEELTNLTIFDLRINEDLALEQLNEAQENGIFFETIHKRKNGSTFPVDVSSQWAAVNDEIGVVSIIRDISKRKNEEEELKKAKTEAETANNAKSEFLANMSHEIRTPINGMVGMIDLTLTTDLDNEQRDNLKIAKSCADSLLKIINDILDFSKMEAGKLIVEEIDFNMKDLIDEIIKTHGVNAEKKGIKLSYSSSSKIPMHLKGDPTRLKQIVNNLMNNAIKFTDEGEVCLFIRKESEDDNSIKLQFEVSDTGIGISPEEKKKLFNKFSQVDASFTRKYGGTGLGLAISKKLSEIMGGTMWVESEKGKGSAFYFTAKFKIGENSYLEPKRSISTQKSNEKSNILIVEDDNINQMVISKMLKRKKYDIDTANNGLEAVDMCCNKKYDLILMDIQLPVLDGIEATKRIREDRNKDTPIVALTAFALKGDRERFISMGMNEYISKPVDMNKLLEIVENLLKANNEIKVNQFQNIRLGADRELVFEEKKSIPIEEIKSQISKISENMELLKKESSHNNLIMTEQISGVIKHQCNEINADEIKSIAFKIQLASRRGDLLEVIKNTIVITEKFKVLKRTVL